MKRSGALTILFVAIVVLLPRASCGGAPLLGRPAVLNRKTDNSTILDIAYSYNDGSLWDNTGNPLKFTENFTGLGLYTYTLRYDWLARQTQETRTNPGGGTDYALVYDYDLVGNRLHRTVGGVTATYNYAANSNRLNSLSGGQDAAFTYDDNGNMTGVSGATFGSKTLVYDDENQLASITYGGVTDTFLYNALGQRYKAVYNGSPTRYLFNGDRVMEELDNNGAVLRRYTTASGSYFGPWLHLWQISDSSSRFPLYNITGSARRLVDATGTIQDVYSYDTFGKGGFVGGNPASSPATDASPAPSPASSPTSLRASNSALLRPPRPSRANPS